jgi:hypothetical protein
MTAAATRIPHQQRSRPGKVTPQKPLARSISSGSPPASPVDLPSLGKLLVANEPFWPYPAGAAREGGTERGSRLHGLLEVCNQGPASASAASSAAISSSVRWVITVRSLRLGGMASIRRRGRERPDK